MKYNRTDKIISDKYKAANPAFDADAAWQDLAPKIKNENGRKGFWLWTLSGLSLIVLVSLFYSFSGSSDEGSIASLTRENNSSSFNTNSSSLDVFVHPLAPFEGGYTKLGSGSAFNIPLRRGARGWKASLLAEQTNSTEYIAIQDPTHDSGDSRLVNRRNNEDGLNTNADPYSSSSSSSSSSNTNSSSMDVFVHPLAPSEGGYTTLGSGIASDGIRILSKKLKKLEYDREIISKVTLSNNLPIEPLSKKSKFRLGVFGGYFKHSRSMESASADGNENYNSRIKEETAIDAFDLGIRFDYFATKNFVVFGGVRFDMSYTERNADYVYLQPITISDYTTVIIETPDGPIEEKEDITFDGYYAHKSHNYLSTKRMGILAGLQYRIGSEKWNTHVDIGVELPVWASLSGIITNDGIPYNLASGELSIGKSQHLIFGGVGAEYSISDRVGLNLMIVGYVPTGNEYQESYNIIKKSTQLGVNLGFLIQL